MRVRDARAQPHESGDRPAAVPRPGAVADLNAVAGCGWGGPRWVQMARGRVSLRWRP